MSSQSARKAVRESGGRPGRKPRIGAFFDMDKTLIAENSGSVFMKYRYEKGEIDTWELLKGAGIYLQYKVGLLDIEAWSRQMALEYTGIPEREIEEEARRIFDDRIIGTLYPEAVEIVASHLAQGHEVVIVSGATRYVVEPLAQHLGVEHILYTRLEVEDGTLTGRVIDPVCFEEGKIYWLQQFIEEENIDLALSYFYTDSVTDLPLLDLVGHPVVTNPDPVLYRTAVRRRWPVRFFTAPEPAIAAEASTAGVARPGATN